MKSINNLQWSIPFGNGERFTHDKLDKDSKPVLNQKGEKIPEDVPLRNMLLKAVYEYKPPGGTLDMFKAMSKLSDKLEANPNAVELSDEHFELLRVAVEQLGQPIPNVRPPLFRVDLIGKIAEILDGEREAVLPKQYPTTDAVSPLAPASPV